MPIFEKEGRRVYFAHIPKTAGTSIYMAFASSGWKILNLSQNPHPQSAFTALNTEFGIKEIERVGDTQGFSLSIQHSPYKIWKAWGPFTDSFAIVRHPADRLNSALRYHYHSAWKHTHQISFDEFVESIFRRAYKRPWNVWKLLDGHLMRQVAFLGPETRTFKYEQDWKHAICERYGLQPAAVTHRNVGLQTDVQLTRTKEFLARMYYYRDYQSLGYTFRNPKIKR